MLWCIIRQSNSHTAIYFIADGKSVCGDKYVENSMYSALKALKLEPQTSNFNGSGIVL